MRYKFYTSPSIKITKTVSSDVSCLYMETDPLACHCHGLKAHKPFNISSGNLYTLQGCIERMYFASQICFKYLLFVLPTSWNSNDGRVQFQIIPWNYVFIPDKWRAWAFCHSFFCFIWFFYFLSKELDLCECRVIWGSFQSNTPELLSFEFTSDIMRPCQDSQQLCLLCGFCCPTRLILWRRTLSPWKVADDTSIYVIIAS